MKLERTQKCRPACRETGLEVTEIDVCAMAAFLLQQLRREHLVTKKRPTASSIIDQLPVTPRKPLNKLFG